MGPNLTSIHHRWKTKVREGRKLVWLRLLVLQKHPKHSSISLKFQIGVFILSPFPHTANTSAECCSCKFHCYQSLLLLFAYFWGIYTFTVNLHSVSVPACVHYECRWQEWEWRGLQSTANPPPASPVLAHYIAEAKKKAEEVRKKTGQWSCRLTQIHQLTMHTAMSHKDNDTPAAAVTSLHITIPVRWA